jgi:hypothetical protein
MNYRDHHALDRLYRYLDQRNKEVVDKFKIQLVLFLSNHEEEFLDAILGESWKPLVKAISAHQDLFYMYKNFTLYLYYMPDVNIHIEYTPKNFLTPISGVTIRYERLCRFSKYSEIKTQCETINYFIQHLQKLKDYIDAIVKSENYTFLQLVRTYPELYAYVKTCFKLKVPPFRKNSYKLPECLAEYLRKIEFMSKV